MEYLLVRCIVIICRLFIIFCLKSFKLFIVLILFFKFLFILILGIIINGFCLNFFCEYKLLIKFCWILDINFVILGIFKLFFVSFI